MGSYGWTIDQVDNLTIHQVEVLIGEIRRRPPPDFLLARIPEYGSVNAQVMNSDNERLNALDAISPVNANKDRPTVRFSKTGSKLVKLVRRSDGKQIW